MSFEFERQLMDLLGDAVKTEDETVGFRYFDARDVLGPRPDPGGSYVVVQKYLHDLKAWRSLSTEKQEAIIGRTKLDNAELNDAEDGRQQSHKSLATIEDEDGNEHDILRDNMPFGSPASGEFGTYFIGYSKKLWVTEKMLERMFIGNPPGLHDRILDFSKAVTGSTFFVPSARVLESLDLIYSLNMVTMAIAKFLPVAVLASLVAGQTLNIPARSGSIISLPAPSVISGSKDMGNKEYDRGRACETDVETPGGHPVFILDDGATLSNAIIGIGQVEGIHCRGACTLENVWFRKVCDDAITLVGNGDILIQGGGAQSAVENVILHQGKGTVTIKDFTVVGSNKLYRACGNCANNGGPRNVVIENVKANKVKLLTGINSNFGDVSTVSNSCGAAVTRVCQEYKGVQKGHESSKVTTTANCKGQTSLSAC
ncbi:hypothetical protein COL922a_007042 [Colletotrichum nupharicola]|nr:hypothetical protein COL922a_007042 [Colletotrichum nupharicola]